MKQTMILLFSAVAVFWNVENFFDSKASTDNPSEIQFSAGGSYHWTSRRMRTKAQAIAKTILMLSDSAGTPPDYIGLAEVENVKVLRTLVYDTALSKFGYRIVHFDSRDPRGIDCALLYRETRPLEARAVPLVQDGDTLRTRDLLLCRFDSLSVLVCHLPSKRGGSVQAAGRRTLALRTIDSLAAITTGPLVVMGDFNDTRTARSDSALTHLVELDSDGGTIKFEGVWEQIDRVLVKDLDGEVHTCDLPILTTSDRAYGGTKPLRTYSGPKYLGGVSDHYPLRIRLETKMATISTGTTQRMKK